MGYKSVTVNDLVCDHCGKIYKNIQRSTNDVLLNKALKDNWTMDNNQNIYCPECKDSKTTLEIKFFWPNFYRMACVEQSIKNSGNNDPIKSIFNDENKLHVIVDISKADKFAMMDWRLTCDFKLNEWSKTCSKLTIVYPDKSEIYEKLICEEILKYNGQTEYVFSYKNFEISEF